MAPVPHARTVLPHPGGQGTSLLRVVWCPAGAPSTPSAALHSSSTLVNPVSLRTSTASAGSLLTCKSPELKVTKAQERNLLVLTNICSGLLQRPDSLNLTGRSQLDEIYSCSRVTSQDLKQMPSHFVERKMKPCYLD